MIISFYLQEFIYNNTIIPRRHKISPIFFHKMILHENPSGEKNWSGGRRNRTRNVDHVFEVRDGECVKLNSFWTIPTGTLSSCDVTFVNQTDQANCGCLVCQPPFVSSLLSFPYRFKVPSPSLSPSLSPHCWKFHRRRTNSCLLPRICRRCLDDVCPHPRTCFAMESRCRASFEL